MSPVTCNVAELHPRTYLFPVQVGGGPGRKPALAEPQEVTQGLRGGLSRSHGTSAAVGGRDGSAGMSGRQVIDRDVGRGLGGARMRGDAHNAARGTARARRGRARAKLSVTSLTAVCAEAVRHRVVSGR